MPFGAVLCMLMLTAFAALYSKYLCLHWYHGYVLHDNLDIPIHEPPDFSPVDFYTHSKNRSGCLDTWLVLSQHHSHTIQTYIPAYQKIVIPVRPTPNDIEPFTRTVSIVSKNTKAPVVIVVNGWNRFRMCTSFMEWLGKKPWAKNVVKVPQSEAIVQAQGVRKSVVDVDRHGAAAEAVRAMCRKMSVLAGLPFEKKQLKKIDTH